MDTVTVSSKYQIVIPEKVREALNIKPGQKVRVLLHPNRIELIPVVPIRQTRGFLKGIDTTVARESDK
ncbi:MAG: AbrB/MazE/SpoVT family DNA-binding domain-containing protein [Chloroflexi bacterium]|nr:AbrB/MazE/SpoVT family DNA-binding domain-containing protein [Chloroflexota bacterium]